MSVQGKVKWFNNKKGYGFIIVDDKEAFVHYSDIENEGYKTLKTGEEVTLELIESEKGCKAVKVVRTQVSKDEEK